MARSSWSSRSFQPADSLSHDHLSSIILDGDGQEHTRDTPEEKALMRRLAADSIVLLKNDGNILPLKPKVS